MKIRTIILLVAAALLLGLSVASAVASVSNARNAIDAIAVSGKVGFNAASRSLIIAADQAMATLDANLKLENWVDNADDLAAAKAEYVRLAIKTADQADRRKLADGHTDEEVAQLVAEAREALEAFIDEEAYDQIENYADLLALEANPTYAALLFGTDATSAPAAAASTTAAASQDSSTEVQLC